MQASRGKNGRAHTSDTPKMKENCGPIRHELLGLIYNTAQFLTKCDKLHSMV